MSLAKNGNAVLAKLSPKSLAALEPQQVTLDVERPIYDTDKRAELCYFPDFGVISVVSVLNDGRCIEVQTIGRESMAGSFLLLGADRMPFRAFVQVAGSGYRVSAGRVIEAASEYSEVRQAVLAAEWVLRVQAMNNCACNGMHTVVQRCSRWLLMASDRVRSNVVHLTHEFLAMMLGVRRASVSDVLGPFDEAGIIQAGRGTITIINRKALEKAACECYRRIATNEPG